MLINQVLLTLALAIGAQAVFYNSTLNSTLVDTTSFANKTVIPTSSFANITSTVSTSSLNLTSATTSSSLNSTTTKPASSYSSVVNNVTSSISMSATNGASTASSVSISTTSVPTNLPSPKNFTFSSNSIEDGVAHFGFDLTLDDYDFTHCFVNISHSSIDLVPGSAEVSFTSNGEVTKGSSYGSFNQTSFFLTLAGGPSTPITKLSFHYEGVTSNSVASQVFDFWLPVVDKKRSETIYVKYTVEAVIDTKGSSGEVTTSTVSADITPAASDDSSVISTTDSATSSTNTATSFEITSTQAKATSTDEITTSSKAITGSSQVTGTFSNTTDTVKSATSTLEKLTISSVESIASQDEKSTTSTTVASTLDDSTSTASHSSAGAKAFSTTSESQSSKAVSEKSTQSTKDTSALVSTDSVSLETTTLVTITSCNDNKCSLVTSSALLSVETTTIEGTVTEYTTYCPLTASKPSSDISESITKSDLSSEETLAASTVIQVYSSSGAEKSSITVENVPQRTAAEIISTVVTSNKSNSTAVVSSLEGAAGKNSIVPLVVVVPLMFLL
ncbi:hypothetical protein ACO0R3_002584 [Hanseniaspora guilliermondii]